MKKDSCSGHQKLLTAVLFMVLAFGFLQPAFAQQNSAAASVILNHYSTRDFAAGSIPRDHLDRIIQAGVRSPSAANRQPWHFTVVQNLDLAKLLVPQTVDGNVLIVVSALGDGITNNVQILDCALAVQSIYLEAQVLGYGSRIYTGPMNNLNTNHKAALGLPQGHSAVALVRVGRLPVDAVSAPSARKSAQEIVTYR